MYLIKMTLGVPNVDDSQLFFMLNICKTDKFSLFRLFSERRSPDYICASATSVCVQTLVSTPVCGLAVFKLEEIWENYL